MSEEPLQLIGLLSRRPDLTLGQFSQHWRTRHRDLSLMLIATGIMHGFIQNHRRPDADPIPVSARSRDCDRRWSRSNRRKPAPRFVDEKQIVVAIVRAEPVLFLIHKAR